MTKLEALEILSSISAQLANNGAYYYILHTDTRNCYDIQDTARTWIDAYYATSPADALSLAAVNHAANPEIQFTYLYSDTSLN